MEEKLHKKKPFARTILLFLLLFQALSGLIGGLGLILNPGGDVIQIPLSLLGSSPFDNYLIPGLILFLLLGVYPFIVFYALIKKPEWKLFSVINIYKDRFWGWTGSLYTGIILILWIDFEILFIGFYTFLYLQTVYGFLGVLILIVTLMPSVQNYYIENNK